MNSASIMQLGNLFNQVMQKESLSLNLPSLPESLFLVGLLKANSNLNMSLDWHFVETKIKSALELLPKIELLPTRYFVKINRGTGSLETALRRRKIPFIIEKTVREKWSFKRSFKSFDSVSKAEFRLVKFPSDDSFVNKQPGDAIIRLLAEGLIPADEWELVSFIKHYICSGIKESVAALGAEVTNGVSNLYDGGFYWTTYPTLQFNENGRVLFNHSGLKLNSYQNDKMFYLVKH